MALLLSILFRVAISVGDFYRRVGCFNCELLPFSQNDKFWPSCIPKFLSVLPSLEDSLRSTFWSRSALSVITGVVILDLAPMLL